MSKLEKSPALSAVAGKPTQRAEVVAALRAGLITREEALSEFGLSPEEIAVWERTFDSLGVRARRRAEALQTG